MKLILGLLKRANLSLCWTNEAETGQRVDQLPDK
jgi:hypothetical protein